VIKRQLWFIMDADIRKLPDEKSYPHINKERKKKQKRKKFTTTLHLNLP
jgi:hypothetical protein